MRAPLAPELVTLHLMPSAARSPPSPRRLTLRSPRTYNFDMAISEAIDSAASVASDDFVRGAGAESACAAARRPPRQGQQPGQDQTQQPPLKVTSGLVHLVAAVSDRRHNFVTDLEKQDFKILEDGKPQTIQFFGRETDLPLRIAMLLDTSNSIRERLHFEKDAATDFLVNVIRRNKDMAFLMTFDNEPEVIQDFTGDTGVNHRGDSEAARRRRHILQRRDLHGRAEARRKRRFRREPIRKSGACWWSSATAKTT